MDLERAETRVLSLQRTAEQFLGSVDSERAACARADLQILSERMKTLLALCLQYMTQIETHLHISRDSPVSH